MLFLGCMVMQQGRAHMESLNKQCSVFTEQLLFRWLWVVNFVQMWKWSVWWDSVCTWNFCVKTAEIVKWNVRDGFSGINVSQKAEKMWMSTQKCRENYGTSAIWLSVNLQDDTWWAWLWARIFDKYYVFGDYPSSWPFFKKPQTYPELRASSIYWIQLSRFYLRMETESSFRNVVF
jgi:hypothetical protein